MVEQEKDILQLFMNTKDDGMNISSNKKKLIGTFEDIISRIAHIYFIINSLINMINLNYIYN